MARTRKIPLFPLGVVLLPKMLLPLHIFEERYKQMIGECLAADKPFGIVLFDGQAIRPVGCMARITRVIKRYDDGRMDILTEGGERFVMESLIEELPYMEARVFFFDDEPEAAPAEKLNPLVKTALGLLRELEGLDTGLVAPPDSGAIDPVRLSYAIAALEGFTPAERQGFLEMTSASQRLERCVQALSRIVKRNRLTGEINKLIGGNGSPPKSILRALKKQKEEGR